MNMTKMKDLYYLYGDNLKKDLEYSRVAQELYDYNESYESSTNGFFYKFIFRNNNLMFSFLFTLFFLWKFITTFIPIPGVRLKIPGLHWSFAILNLLVFLICLLIYLAYSGFSLFSDSYAAALGASTYLGTMFSNFTSSFYTPSPTTGSGENQI